MKTGMRTVIIGVLFMLAAFTAPAADATEEAQSNQNVRTSPEAPRAAKPAAGPKTRILIDADTANEVDDLYAIVRALIHPQFGEEIRVTTPPENTPREVHVFSRIDGPKIREEFYSALGTYYNLDLDSDTP